MLTIEHFYFFEIQHYAMEWCHQQRRIFKLASAEVLKLLHFLFSLIQILWPPKHLQRVKDKKRCFKRLRH